jgi:hypothetical protein
LISWSELGDSRQLNLSRSGISSEFCDSNTPNKLLFPYGLSKFDILRQEPRYLYVDKTFIIRELELDMPRHVIIHRPARWGKSMFMSVLRCYYDKSQAHNFDKLFGGLNIGIDPTTLKSSYHVLSLDLTLDVDSTMTPAEIRKRLEKKVFSFAEEFAAYYNFPIPQELGESFGLKTIAKQVCGVGGKLLILVDEYDRFANKLMFENPAAYDEIVRGGRGDTMSSPIRAFFEAIKEVSSFYDCRSIVTGIAPIALSDASGGNIWMDLTLDESIGDVFGFSDDDLRTAFRHNGLAGAEIERVLNVMREYYNGFKFVGSSCNYYNPTLALYFLLRYFKSKSETFRKLIDDQSTLDQDDLSIFLQDKNVDVSQKVFSLLSQSPAIDSVCSKLLNKDSPMVLSTILQVLPLTELTDNGAEQSIQEHRIASFMYYHGIATLTSAFPFQLQVPNQQIRGPFLDRLRNTITSGRSEFVSCFTNPTAESMQILMQNIVDGQETVKDNYFSESALQTELETALNAVRREMRGFVVLAGRSAGGGRFDLCILTEA